VLCTTVVHSDTHTHEQFLEMSVGLGFVGFFVHFFRFGILCVFWFSLDCFVMVALWNRAYHIYFQAVVCYGRPA